MGGGLLKNSQGPISGRAIVGALLLHLLVGLVIWTTGVLTRPKKQEIIPIDLTVVPPWAQQTTDPDPDPNPPPKPQTRPKPQPKPDPAPEKKIEPKVDAVEKVVEKKKPEKPKPKEKIDLRKEATLVKTPPKPAEPVDLRKEATKIEPPPQIKTTGKGTAAEKPLSPEEFKRLMNQGYRVGTHNQIADNEVSRCMNLIVRAIRLECERDGIRWNVGQQPVRVEISFGAGGRITGCRLTKSCGDAKIDRQVMSAIGRLGAVGGLSSTFLQQCPLVPASIEPL